MFSIPGLHRQIQKYARTRQTLMLVKFDSQKPCSAVSHPRLEGWFQCNHRRRAPSPVVCATRQMNLAREDIEDSESSTYIGVPSPRRALGVDYGRKCVACLALILADFKVETPFNGHIPTKPFDRFTLPLFRKVFISFDCEYTRTLWRLLVFLHE